MSKMSLDEANHGRTRPRRKNKTGPADYAGLDGAEVLKCIETLANWGCAIRFGKSRDGGAFAIGVYGVDEQPYTEFIPPSEDPTAYLQELVAWMEGKPGPSR